MCNSRNFNCKRKEVAWYIAQCLLRKFHSVETTKWTFFFFFGGGTGVWTQGLSLARQVLYHLSLAPNPVSALVIFQVKSHIFAQGLASDFTPLTYNPHVAKMTISIITPAYLLRCGLTHFLPKLSLTLSLLISYLSRSWCYRHEPPHLVWNELCDNLKIKRQLKGIDTTKW
jgi:hypothetical protein